MRYWLDVGVDGFYVHDAAHLVESVEPPYAADAAASASLLRRWRRLLDEYSLNDGRPRYNTTVNTPLWPTVKCSDFCFFLLFVFIVLTCKLAIDV